MGRLIRVVTAFALFGVVEYAIWIAVLLWAYDLGGAPLAGLVSVLQLLPAVLLTPLAGAFGDRLPRGTALALAYLVEAALLGATAVALRTDSVAAVAVTAAAATTAISVARPVHYAALPALAPTPRALVTANSASGVADGMGAFVGPVLAGLVAAGAGPWTVAAAGAGGMLVAATLVLGLGLPGPMRKDDSNASALSEAAAGVRVVSRDRPVMALLLLVGTGFLVAGALEVLGVSFADAVLGGGEEAAGLLVGAVGIGALVGALAAAGLAVRPRLAAPVVAGLVTAGIPLLAMAGAGSLPAASVLVAVCGLGSAFAGVAGRTLLQRSTDDVVLARVFAVQEAVTLAGLAIGAAVAPLLIEWFGPVRAYVPFGLALVGGALASLPLLRALDRRATFRPDVVALLHRIGFLAAMPPPALARLASRATWVDVESGTRVVVQGDTGDAYFVVSRGRLAVEVDGARRTHELTEGDGFGEIALLRGVPRTATVLAVEASRLLRVERDDFLAAVTGSPDGAAVAEGIASAHLARDARGW